MEAPALGSRWRIAVCPRWEGTPFLFDLRDLDAYIERHKHTAIDLFAS
jgi:hypothetical protein